MESREQRKKTLERRLKCYEEDLTDPEYFTDRYDPKNFDLELKKKHLLNYIEELKDQLKNIDSYIPNEHEKVPQCIEDAVMMDLDGDLEDPSVYELGSEYYRDVYWDVIFCLQKQRGIYPHKPSAQQSNN